MPATKTRKPAELSGEFVAASQPGPLLGAVRLVKGRVSGTYALIESAPEAGGRAFKLVKHSGGSDDAGDQYTCTTTFGGSPVACDCRGHLRHGSACKHLEAVGGLVYRGEV